MGGVGRIELATKIEKTFQTVLFADNANRENGLHQHRMHIFEHVADEQRGVVFADTEKAEVNTFLENGHVVIVQVRTKTA